MDLLKGKDVVVFCTHEGGPKETLQKMVDELGGSNVVGRGDFHRPKGNEETQRSVSKVKTWVKGIQEG